MENNNETKDVFEKTSENNEVVNEANAAQESEVLTKEEIEKLRLQQNLPLAIVAGVVAGLVSALLWAVISVVTGYQIGYMAIAVGAFVGFAMRFAGKGVDNIFGILGAVIALLGCALGNFLSIIGFLAAETTAGYMQTLAAFDFAGITEVMKATFEPIDALFYGLALYTGYKFSFRQIKE